MKKILLAAAVAAYGLGAMCADIYVSLDTGKNGKDKGAQLPK